MTSNEEDYKIFLSLYTSNDLGTATETTAIEKIENPTTSEHFIPTKVTRNFLIADLQTSHYRSVTLWIFITFILIALVLLVISIYVTIFPTYGTMNIGTSLCCSPIHIYPGQFIQHGYFIFWLQKNGNVQFLVELPNDKFQVLWESNLINVNVKCGELKNTGVFELIDINNNVVWEMKPSTMIPDEQIVAPFSLEITDDGHLVIKNNHRQIVYDHPPNEINS